PLGGPQLPPALAGQPEAGRAPEAERLDVLVVAVAAQREADLDRPHVRRELEHLAEREPAVALPVVDRLIGDRDDALLAVEPVVGPDDPFLERGGGQDRLEGGPRLERVADGAVPPLLGSR